MKTTLNIIIFPIVNIYKWLMGVEATITSIKLKQNKSSIFGRKKKA